MILFGSVPGCKTFSMAFKRDRRKMRCVVLDSIFLHFLTLSFLDCNDVRSQT